MKLDRNLKLIISWLFIFLAFVLPLTFSFKTSELFEFPKMMLTYGFVSIIVGLWLVRMIVNKRVIFRRTYLDIPIGLFFFSQLAATIFSIHPYTSIFGYYSRFHGGLLSTIVYILLYYALVSNANSKIIKKIIYAGVASGLMIAVYGILEHLGHSISCLMVSKGQSFGVDCWVQDVQARVFATLGQPNWMAALMDILIFFTLYLSLKTRSVWQSLAWLSITLMMFTSLIYTGSRSGFLAAIAGLIWWLTMLVISLTRKRQNSKYTYYVIGHNTKHTYYYLAGVILSFAFTIISIGSPFSTNLKELTTRYLKIIKTETHSGPADSVNEILLQTKTDAANLEKTSPTPNHQPQTTNSQLSTKTQPAASKPTKGGTDSGVIRAIVWKGAIDLFKAHPLLGTGPGTFAYSYYQYRPNAHNAVSEWNFLYNKAHNEFLNFAAETGSLGLGSYIILLMVFFGFSLRLLWQGKRPLLLASLTSAILALTVSNFFGFSTVTVSVWMWLIFGFVALIDRDDDQDQVKPPTLDH